MRTLAELVVGVALLLTILLHQCLRGAPGSREPSSNAATRNDQRSNLPPFRNPWLRSTFNGLTGEWVLLSGRANGGDVILIRTILISVLVYVPAIVIHSWASSGWSFDFDLQALGKELSETLQWVGAIFAGVYVALYTRFSAQWSYLADVYNQIMAAESAIACPTDRQRDVLSLWKAGFVEDAVTLHLATKKIFAEVVWILLQREDVRAAVDESIGAGKRKALQSNLKRLHPRLQDDSPLPSEQLPRSLVSCWIPR
ncbi:hypothetical protein [Mycobacterium sp. 852002-51961_SCH5331710]|uniref:hypothetical protein n=1 Tax=Mycobacterium sp. 852002-51961_SCH5331710 TaxID=1834105 RepID=UPI000B0AFF8B|nr:hypothetical protein [Mycobacterium sp. 852002-51961_SCH5331710]